MNSARRLLQEEIRGFRNPPKISAAEWAEQFRRMSAVESAFVGRFSFRPTPFWKWFLDRWSQPDVKKGVAQKPAQIGWTQNVICNALGHNVHVERSTCIVMFPKDGSARNFDLEKFGPMVDATPALSPILPVKSRAKGQKTLFKSFPGGFIKFVGSNSISDVKSTSAKRLFIEEPDDCNLNLRGQGDAIKLLEERGKTFRDVKMLIGGTPSIKGVSSIEDEMLASDQNRWMVPCPDCGEFQALEWEQVRWQDGAEVEHPIYGRAKTETAMYVCAACGSCWDDAQKNQAVQRGRAEPQAPFRGVLGLYINELYASWNESRLQVLAERYLTAKYEEAQGNLEALIVFWNACLGRSWEHKNALAVESVLALRGLDYAVNTVPAGGLVLTMGVDVQHNRLAVILRAWGRGEESWLVLFDEIEGNAVDKNDSVWTKLDELVFATYPHAWGVALKVRAISIDAGDGTAADAVYHWVRTRKGRGAEVMAIKGSGAADSEIFRRPTASIDSTARNTKAAKHGLRTFMVGVNRAKDLLLGDKGPGRLALDGDGPGRIHWYKDVRADYLEQFAAEVKVPVRGARGKRIWQTKKGVRNEVLDAEIYALHAARALKVHLAREAQWAALEAALRQQELLAVVPPAPVVIDPEPSDDAPVEVVQTSAPVPQSPVRIRRSNWVTGFRQ
jgi:phage terminase large subunit GpA-like protein